MMNRKFYHDENVLLGEGGSIMRSKFYYEKRIRTQKGKFYYEKGVG